MLRYFVAKKRMEGAGEEARAYVKEKKKQMFKSLNNFTSEYNEIKTLNLSNEQPLERAVEEIRQDMKDLHQRLPKFSHLSPKNSLEREGQHPPSKKDSSTKIMMTLMQRKIKRRKSLFSSLNEANPEH